MPAARSHSSRVSLSRIPCFAFLCASLAGTSIGQEQPTPVPTPIPIAETSSKYLDAVEAHMEYVTEHSLDEYGETHTPMWLATIDIKTNRLPTQPLPRNLRWYRKITSPRGSNLYLDQPTIVAAYELSKRTGCKCYSDAAEAYTQAFLRRCVDTTSGLISWGNHRYYDVVADEVVEFNGGYHECRPHTPAWETLWAIDPELTERTIRSMGKAHIKDPASGKFCRHANVNAPAGQFTASEIDQAMPFLEAGAVLIDSLCWLAKQTDDPQGELAEQALRVARYSYAQRNKHTGLIRNQPIQKRWDYHASTTEIGLWASSLLRASQYTGKMDFQRIAEDALVPWLQLGFDANAKQYFGILSVDSGRPASEEKPRGYMPPMYADVFDIHERPSHNYPMPMAEACLTLYEETGREIFREASVRWVGHVRESLPANDARGAYAEDYGRVIHYLVRAAKVLESPEYRDLAGEVADEAMSQLYAPKMGMFRSHSGEDRCDAVDGPGLLIVALLYLEGTDPTSASALHF